MTNRVTDQPEGAIASDQSEAVPVLITFALLFLLSAAVWFVLDRIRSDEVKIELSQRSQIPKHESAAQAATMRSSKVTGVR